MEGEHQEQNFTVETVCVTHTSMDLSFYYRLKRVRGERGGVGLGGFG